MTISWAKMDQPLFWQIQGSCKGWVSEKLMSAWEGSENKDPSLECLPSTSRAEAIALLRQAKQLIWLLPSSLPFSVFLILDLSCPVFVRTWYSGRLHFLTTSGVFWLVTEGTRAAAGVQILPFASCIPQTSHLTHGASVCSPQRVELR